MAIDFNLSMVCFAELAVDFNLSIIFWQIWLSISISESRLEVGSIERIPLNSN